MSYRDLKTTDFGQPASGAGLRAILKTAAGSALDTLNRRYELGSELMARPAGRVIGRARAAARAVAPG